MSDAPVGDIDFQNTVAEILADMPKGLTSAQFRTRAQPFVNACYHAEVAEAERRYFAKERPQ